MTEVTKLKEEAVPVKDTAKERALQDTFKTIEKAYGKGSIMRLGDTNGKD